MSSVSVRLLVLLYSVFNEHWLAKLLLRLVGSSGLEPPTSRLSGARSNHLSYEPIQFPVYLVPLTLCASLIIGL